MQMTKYFSCQDGDQFYIQDDPEAETWIASFNNEIEADKYCEMLNKQENNSDFKSKVFEIAFGDNAINRDFSENEVLEKLNEFSENALLWENKNE